MSVRYQFKCLNGIAPHGFSELFHKNMNAHEGILKINLIFALVRRTFYRNDTVLAGEVSYNSRNDITYRLSVVKSKLSAVIDKIKHYRKS